MQNLADFPGERRGIGKHGHERRAIVVGVLMVQKPPNDDESARVRAEQALSERLKSAHSYLHSALSPDDRDRLDDVYARVQGAATTLAGYPCNQVFDYTELLPFLKFSINNVGDPFADSNYRLNTHDIEREVLAQFSHLTHANEQEVWGYVTSGGTEGNLYGLYLARELWPQGIVYYSEDTHYSVAKSLRLLRARSIMIRSQDSGELDYDDLREALKIHRDVPPILFMNIGTTMKGAIDRVDRVQDMLRELRLQEHYIHCDAALSGMILPFVEDPPPWDFAAGVDSLSISGHKMLGAPVPCGVVLARRKHVERIARSVEYVGVLDTTIGGSRSGLAPLILWYALRRWGVDGLTDLVADCEQIAEYAVDTMRAAGIEAWRHPHSITVVMPRPSDDVVRRFQIAPQGNLGHLIAMPHITRRLVDYFVQEYLLDPPAAWVRCARPSAGSHLRPGSIPPASPDGRDSPDERDAQDTPEGLDSLDSPDWQDGRDTHVDVIERRDTLASSAFDSDSSPGQSGVMPTAQRDDATEQGTRAHGPHDDATTACGSSGSQGQRDDDREESA